MTNPSAKRQQPSKEALERARKFRFPRNVWPTGFGDWMKMEVERLAVEFDAIAKAARLGAFEEVKHICEVAANGTIEKMSEPNCSETWKILAQQSVEQYHSIIKRIAELEKQP